MPRFVILRHDLPPQADRPTHWDLMLEQADGLATWALAAPPAAGHTVAATRLADHRPRYLTFEGPLSGDRGAVTRWDAGTYRLIVQSTNLWRVTLAGRILCGELLLAAAPPPRLETPAAADPPARWTARFAAPR